MVMGLVSFEMLDVNSRVIRPSSVTALRRAMTPLVHLFGGKKPSVQARLELDGSYTWQVAEPTQTIKPDRALWIFFPVALSVALLSAIALGFILLFSALPLLGRAKSNSKQAQVKKAISLSLDKITLQDLIPPKIPSEPSSVVTTSAVESQEIDGGPSTTVESAAIISRSSPKLRRQSESSRLVGSGQEELMSTSNVPLDKRIPGSQFQSTRESVASVLVSEAPDTGETSNIESEASVFVSDTGAVSSNAHGTFNRKRRFAEVVSDLSRSSDVHPPAPKRPLPSSNYAPSSSSDGLQRIPRTPNLVALADGDTLEPELVTLSSLTGQRSGLEISGHRRTLSLGGGDELIVQAARGAHSAGPELAVRETGLEIDKSRFPLIPPPEHLPLIPPEPHAPVSKPERLSNPNLDLSEDELSDDLREDIDEEGEVDVSLPRTAAPKPQEHPLPLTISGLLERTPSEEGRESSVGMDLSVLSLTEVLDLNHGVEEQTDADVFAWLSGSDISEETVTASTMAPFFENDSARRMAVKQALHSTGALLRALPELKAEKKLLLESREAPEQGQSIHLAELEAFNKNLKALMPKFVNDFCYRFEATIHDMKIVCLQSKENKRFLGVVVSNDGNVQPISPANKLDDMMVDNVHVMSLEDFAITYELDTLVYNEQYHALLLKGEIIGYGYGYDHVQHYSARSLKDLDKDDTLELRNCNGLWVLIRNGTMDSLVFDPREVANLSKAFPIELPVLKSQKELDKFILVPISELISTHENPIMVKGPDNQSQGVWFADERFYLATGNILLNPNVFSEKQMINGNFENPLLRLREMGSDEPVIEPAKETKASNRLRQSLIPRANKAALKSLLKGTKEKTAREDARMPKTRIPQWVGKPTTAIPRAESAEGVCSSPEARALNLEDKASLQARFSQRLRESEVCELNSRMEGLDAFMALERLCAESGADAVLNSKDLLHHLRRTTEKRNKQRVRFSSDPDVVITHVEGDPRDEGLLLKSRIKPTRV